MPAAQMVRYPKHGGLGEITFSFWAFPVDGYVDVLRAYFNFCRQYDRNHGYRGDVLTVGYLVSQDTSSIFSYSSEGPVATIDPVSTGGLE